MIARVFPRKTKASPTDSLAFFDAPDLLTPEVDSVNISVAFTWDLPRAEWLEKQWRHVAPVSIGGPATGTRGEEFAKGKYLADGYVITSRGCPNNCWFCSVPLREGPLRELPIQEGWNVLDDNLLACSEPHIRSVFEMLKRQKVRPVLSGGLEAARLKQWHVDLIKEARVDRFYFAYDEQKDRQPLMDALSLVRNNGLINGRHRAMVYVLVGYPGDTIPDAEIRLKEVCAEGATPMAMLWRDRHGVTDYEWRKFQREWARPSIIYGK